MNEHNYVTREECEEHRRKNSEKFENLSVMVTEIKTTLKITVGILSAIGVAVLAVALKTLFGG